MNVVPVQITYNEPDFDPEHYPLQDWHKQAIAKIHRQLRLPISTPWWYQATIHGAVFWFKRQDKQARLEADTIKFLADLPGFRWVEKNDGAIAIGLDHTLTDTH